MNRQYKYITLLAMLYVTFAQIAYVLAYKIVHVIGFVTLPAGVLVFPLIYTLSDVITEVYGYKRMRRIIWESIICGLIFVLSITLLLQLPSNNAMMYEQVLGKIWRIYLAIILAVTLGSFANIYVISKWKILVQGRYFWFRSICSTAVGEIIATLIADVIAFYGVMSLKKVFAIVVSIYLFKLVYAACAAIPATFLVKFLKKTERLDVYDVNIKFNPFKMDVSTKGEKNASTS